MTDPQLALAASIVVPVFNEADSLPGLYERLIAVMASAPAPYRDSFEIIFIDDGSTDNSFRVCSDLHRNDGRVVVIRFRRNFGKTAALRAGFVHSRGERIITIDADLQEDPASMIEMLSVLDAGHDLVSGWRVTRNDPWTKRIPSKVFNTVVAKLTGVTLHDINCGFKAYRRPLIQEIMLTGDMHRFIPVLAQQRGFSITEIPVQHQKRKYGHSKFGAGRLGASYLDFFEVLYLITFSHQPFRLFGLIGSSLALIGFVCLAYLIALWLLDLGPIGIRPLLFFGVLSVLAGLQFISIGLIGTMLRDATHATSRSYSIAHHLPEKVGSGAMRKTQSETEEIFS